MIKLGWIEKGDKRVRWSIKYFLQQHVPHISNRKENACKHISGGDMFYNQFTSYKQKMSHQKNHERWKGMVNLSRKCGVIINEKRIMVSIIDEGMTK